MFLTVSKSLYDMSSVFLSQNILDEEYDRMSNDPYYAHISPMLLKREIELEGMMRSYGLSREWSSMSKNIASGIGSDTSYGHAILKKNVHVIADALAIELDALKLGRAGSNRSALRHIKNIDTETVAYLALKAILDALSRDKHTMSLQAIAAWIGRNIEDEARCRRFYTVSPKRAEIAKNALKKSRKTYTGKRKHDVFFGVMERARKGMYGNDPDEALAWDGWSKADKVILGTKLSMLIADVTGLITIKKAKMSKGKWMYTVSLDDALYAWIDKWAWNTGLMSPLRLPTVIPPRHYTCPTDGAYHTSLLPKDGMTKSKDRGYLSALSDPDVISSMSCVYDAVNTAMDTAWRINQRVLDTMLYLWRIEADVACLPSQHPMPKPVCPKCGGTVSYPHRCFEEDKEAHRRWSAQASQCHSLDEANRSNGLILHRILWVAQEYRDDEAIYFPYQLDFRGRLYALPNFLNPQGSDVAKGLLEFSEGKALGDQEAADWLAIHVANTHGEDKLSFQERIAWTKEHEDEILAIADDPIGNVSLWHDADSPFCYLAACIEWAGYLREGLSFVSRIPIALDGTCSGLQHYSAMLRDEDGGKHVNLMPSDRPADIYKAVAMRTKEILEDLSIDEDAPVEDRQLALEWLNSGIIDRKLTKRAVMTLPYGVSLFSAKDYIYDRVLECVHKEHKSLPWSTETTQNTRERLERFNIAIDTEGTAPIDPLRHAAQWIGGHVWMAIKDVVVAAPIAMDWLRRCASVIVKAGIPVSWVAPSGLPVLQPYVQTKDRRVSTVLSGGIVYDTNKERKRITADEQMRIQLTLKETTDTLDVNKQRTGVAPNFVHSLDASALMFAVNEAKSVYGIKAFALIHDSFATHAADTEAFAHAIRSAFIRMYEDNDPLEAFAARARRLVGDAAIPTVPSKGTLDLKQVMDATYFVS